MLSPKQFSEILNEILFGKQIEWPNNLYPRNRICPPSCWRYFIDCSSEAIASHQCRVNTNECKATYNMLKISGMLWNTYQERKYFNK